MDPSYLAEVEEKAGVTATFIQRANEVNLEMPKYIAGRVAKENGGSLKGKNVLVVGVACLFVLLVLLLFVWFWC